MVNGIKELIAKCDTCQRHKTTNNPRAGKIPLRDPHTFEPFELLTVDLGCPWKMSARVEYEISIKGREKKLVREEIIIVDISCSTMVGETAEWSDIVP